MPYPKHRPSPESRARVEAWAAVGLAHHHIAKLMPMSTHTLLKHYKNELEIGKAKANAQAGTWLFELCSQKNLGALCFWLKTQAGWRESTETVLTGDKSKPVVISNTAARW